MTVERVKQTLPLRREGAAGPRPIHYWRPGRRTRNCLSCDHREAIRTTAFGAWNITSLCTRHWTQYVQLLPQFDRDRLTEGQPRND